MLRCILLSLLLVCWPCGISCAQSQTVELSLTDLTALEANCKAQETALEQSLQELEEARILLADLTQELTESETALSESQEALTELKAELLKHKLELAKLKSELSQLKTESLMLSGSLMKAEQSLKDAEKKYKKENKKAARKERLWQVVAVIAGGFAVGK